MIVPRQCSTCKHLKRRDPDGVPGAISNAIGQCLVKPVSQMFGIVAPWRLELDSCPQWKEAE